MSVNLEWQSSDDAASWRVQISGDVTIYQAEQFKQLLLDHPTECRHLECDLNGVDEFDSAGAQLLLGLGKTLRERGGALTIAACSASVSTHLNTLGLARAELLGATHG